MKWLSRDESEPVAALGWILSRIDEAVGFELVLLVVQHAVAAAERHELLVRSSLDDFAVLEHEDLVGAADRGQPVRDDERRPPLAERAQAVLDLGFAFAVERRGRFVEHEDARVGEDGARDRDALTLTARQLHPALSDDGVVLLLEPLDELVGVRDAADGLDLLERRVRAPVADVGRDRAIEEEVVL